MANVNPNGNAYSDDGSAARDMRKGGWRLWLLPMIGDVLAEIAALPGKAAAAAVAAAEAILTPLAAAAQAAATAAAGSSGTAATKAGEAADSATAASVSAAAAANSAAGLIATSTTPLTLGTGTRVFVVEAGKIFGQGTRARAVNAADPSQWVEGTVASYSGTSLNLTVDAFEGSGTVNNWAISISGARGAEGKVGGVNGGSLAGVLNFKQAGDLAVSATPDIWSVTGNTVKLTGSGTITGFPAAPLAGARRTLVMGGAVTLTNGPNLVVLGGTRALVAGDMVEVVAVDSTTTFRAIVERANGLAPAQPAPTIAPLGSSTVPGAVLNIDFLNNFSTDYDHVQIHCAGLAVSAAGDIQLRFARAGVVDAANNYLSNTSAAAQGRVVVSMPTGSRFSGVIDVFGLNDPARCAVVARGCWATPTQHIVMDNIGFGYETGGGPITGFRLLHSAGGSFMLGTVRVYGMRNAAGVI